MTPSDLPQIVRESLLSLGVKPGDGCLLAFSGGQDSTALLLAMLEGWDGRDPITAVHLDHAVRQGSEKEQETARRVCEGLGVEIITGRLDPGELSSETRKTGSLEAAMRTCRYRYLLSCARATGKKWLLTGHTADDQVETVLFRIFRGMDPMSLVGIPCKRSTIVRPLLGISRDLTLRYCLEKGIAPLKDPSNSDSRFARNRIRNNTIPALRTSFHPDLGVLVLKLSSLVRRLEIAREAILGCFDIDDSGSGINALSILRHSSVPVAMRRSAIGRFLKAGTGNWPSASQLREAEQHVYGSKRGRMSLPGGKILASSGDRTYIYDDRANRNLSIPLETSILPVPGRVCFEASGTVVSAQYGTLLAIRGFPSGDTVLIARKGLLGPLRVRRRHPGDRFRPLGMNHDKKLKDFFIDRKIPFGERDRIPLVLDGEEDILWVAGIEISAKAALEGYKGEEVVVLRIEKSGQEARAHNGTRRVFE